MLSRTTLLLRPVVGFTVFLAVLSWGSTTRGQDSLPPGNGQSDIEKAYKAKGRVCLDLLNGRVAFDSANKDQQEALDIGAKNIVYRLTWPGVDTERGKIDEVYQLFEDQQFKPLKNYLKKTEQAEGAKAVVGAYTKVMAARARDVINLRSINGRKPDIVRVNAARILAQLAELGQDELADALLDVFNQEIARDADPSGPKRNDGVVYYMLRGMRDLLAIPQPAPPAKPALTQEHEKKLAEALTAFIAKAPPFTKDTPADEIDGYRVMRREAVRGLALCRAPGLKGKERPAWTLLRVMARDGFTPEPRIDECVEAAIGVARLRATPELDGKDYQPGYAAFQLALFTDYFVKYYLNNVYNPTDKTRLVEQRPYRIYAARLMEALEAMKADAKDPYVEKTVDECRKVLLFVEKGESTRTLELEEWLNGNKPAQTSLFKDLADSTVKPANRP